MTVPADFAHYMQEDHCEEGSVALCGYTFLDPVRAPEGKRQDCPQCILLLDKMEVAT